MAAAIAGLTCLSLPSGALAQRTLVTVSPEPSISASGPSLNPVFSPNGRHLFFRSGANNIVANDNGAPFLDLFRHDLATGQTVLVSVNHAGTGGGNANVDEVFSSADGETVVFASEADNLVNGDTNGESDVFLRDPTGVISLVSKGPDGSGGRSPLVGLAKRVPGSVAPVVSGDGRWVVFESAATNLVEGTTNGIVNLFAFDAADGTLRLLTGSAWSAEANGFLAPLARSGDASVSMGGHRIAFFSDASGVVEGVTNTAGEVYLHETEAGNTTLVSTNLQSLLGVAGPVRAENPAISAGGGRMMFTARSNGSTAVALVHLDLLTGERQLVTADLEPGSVPQLSSDGMTVLHESEGQVYLWKASTGMRVLVSRASDGLEPANARAYNAAMTPSATHVAFLSDASNLVEGVAPETSQLYWREIASGQTLLVSRNSSGGPGSRPLGTGWPALNGDGSLVAFQSSGDDFVPDDHNLTVDIFVRDIAGAQTDIISRVAPGLIQQSGRGEPRVGPGCLTADRRRVVFRSWDNTLTPNDTNRQADVFVRDLITGATSCLSTNDDGGRYLEWGAFAPVISADGSTAAFVFQPPGFFGIMSQPVVVDLETGQRTFVMAAAEVDPGSLSHGLSLSRDGSLLVFKQYGGGLGLHDVARSVTTSVNATDPGNPQISPNGRLVVWGGAQGELAVFDRVTEETMMLGLEFGGRALSLRTVAGFSADSLSVSYMTQDGSGYVHDLLTHTNRLVGTDAQSMGLSGDGRLVAFEALPDRSRSVSLRDLTDDSTLLVATNSVSGPSMKPSLTFDGRYLIFVSNDESLVAEATDGLANLYVYDVAAGATLLASINRDGTAGGNGGSVNPVLGADGRTVVFHSMANDLVDGDYSDRGNLYLLTLSSGDGDGDELEDDWEYAYFGNLDQGPDDDFDGDGHSNREEYRAGTDPTNEESVFRVITLSGGEGGARLIWGSFPGKVYRAQYREAVGEGEWHDIPGDVTSSGSTATKLDSASEGGTQRYYRVVLLE